MKLIVEVDGEHHHTAEGRERDERRDWYLAESGYTLLRIPGYQVLRDPAGVRQLIEQAIDERKEHFGPLTPAPLPQQAEGEGGRAIYVQVWQTRAQRDVAPLASKISVLYVRDPLSRCRHLGGDRERHGEHPCSKGAKFTDSFAPICPKLSFPFRSTITDTGLTKRTTS